MTKLIFFASLILHACLVSAQNYPVGETTVSFSDPSRNNRQIPVRVFYPAAAQGTDVPVNTALITFPVVVFGHGYGIPLSAYQLLWEKIVPLGFILVMPATETGSTVSPASFALDMSFVYDSFFSLNTNAGSLFFNRLSARGAIGGHSMGGGCSMLAAADNADIDCVFSYAAAEITPSPIQASSNISIPLLMLGGDKDCATPYASNQQPMYQAAPSDCKALVILTGANHCQFALPNTGCQQIEAQCGGIATITDSVQQDRAAQLLVPFLKWQLNNDDLSRQAYRSLLAQSPNAATTYQCETTVASTLVRRATSISPNPASGKVKIMLNDNTNDRTHLVVLDVCGRHVFEKRLVGDKEDIDVSGFPDGVYSFFFSAKSGRWSCLVLVRH